MWKEASINVRPCSEIELPIHNPMVDVVTLNDYFYTMLAQRAITCKEKTGIAPNIAIIGNNIIIQESSNYFKINSLEHRIFVREALKTLDARLYFKSIIDALTIQNATDNK